MSHSVLAGLQQAIDAAQTNRSILAIVITGAGTKAFCAGADLQSANAFTTDYSDPTGHLARVLRSAKASHIPLIARVNGACMAGGMGLMAMCDMAVSTPEAVFGLPEVKVGVFPAQVLAVLQHLIPKRKLAEMCITGEPITSAQALGNRFDQLRQRRSWLRKFGQQAAMVARPRAGQITRRHSPWFVHHEKGGGHVV